MVITRDKVPFTIPDEPVDQFRVKYYRLSISESWVYITEIEAVYHVNTPWSEYASAWKGVGADIVDDWMVYPNGSKQAEGRICGWSDIVTRAARFQSGKVFATREEAVQASIEKITGYIEEAELHLRELRQRRETQKGSL